MTVSEKCKAIDEPDKPVLRVYPIGSDAFVAKIRVTTDHLEAFAEPSQIATVVLLDRSGSMGDWVITLVKNYLPNLFRSLGYGKDDPVTILAFDHNCEVVKWSIGSHRQCGLFARGGTTFTPAIRKLSEYLQAAEKQNVSVRILTISDGEIFDKDQALAAAQEITQNFKSKIRINSQAVQIFSSSGANPDTTALCSLLQLNNTRSTKVANIYKRMSDSDCVASITELFEGDSLEYNLKLQADKSVFKKELWDADMQSSVNLVRGDNLIWLDASQVDALTSGKIAIKFGNSCTPVQVVCERKRENIQDVTNLLQDHFQHVYEYLKVLRIIDSHSSQATLSNIVNLYGDLEAQLKLVEELPASQILADSTMTGRLIYLRQEVRKRDLGFAIKMANIANDNTIDKLNSAQKAEYLRSTVHSKTSRGLAKRAALSGFNFDEIARDEVQAIAKNLAELTDKVDDSAHQCSFYSMETTLGGIKTVASLVNEDNFDQLTANEILLLLNVVGIACEGPVGDFPDPMTWRVNKIYPGVFVSVSDLMTSKIQSGFPDDDYCLEVPGHDNSKITNVIPVFEDIRIAEFLRKYAPHLLSYTCSIGMRGMIAHVVMTDGYTLCAGIWKLVEHIARNPTELNLKTFKHLVTSYDLFSGDYFKHSRDCLLAEPMKDPKGNLLSFYLNNNGLTNMIAPIYHHLDQKRTKDALKANSAAILRALFSYEIWQAFRREFKGAESQDKIDEMLSNLLGIDYEKYGLEMPPLFEKELSPDQIKLHDEAHFNFDYLMDILDTSGWYLKYVSIIILLLEHVANDTLETIRSPLENCLKDETFLKAQYGLPDDYDFKEFLMYSAVQSLLYPKASDRVDQDNSKMFTSDLIDPCQIKEMIKKYIKSKYQSHYDTERVKRRKAENAKLLSVFLNKMRACTKRAELIELFKTGVSRKEKTYCYTGFSSYGFIELKHSILDTSTNMPLRKDALVIFLTACDWEAGKADLFNSGKVAVLADISEFERVFLQNCNGSPQEWQEIYDEYKIRSIHSYRDGKPNRHSHHNGKPSYWALGWPTLEAFAKEHTEEEFEEYCRIHCDCCGVNQIVKK